MGLNKLKVVLYSYLFLIGLNRLLLGRFFKGGDKYV